MIIPDSRKLLKEKQIEDTYILLTNDPKIPAYDALFTYKNLSEVEDFFRELKDNLGIRPNYHRTDKRIKAHIFISHLALLLLCILKRTLKKKNINLSSQDVIELVETIGIACLNINGEKMQEDEIIAEASPDKEEILFVRADLELILNERKQEPTLRNLRKDLYQELLRLFVR